MFRRAFALDGRVRSARIYVTSLGLYELHLNGHRVGEDLFTPGWTSYNKRIQYQVYDVTGLLARGENVVGAILGDGWYRGYLGFSQRKNDYGTRVALLLQMEIRYADGRTVRVTSDSTWKSATGPIVYSDIYHGESYDARLERTGWDNARYDDREWHSVERGDASQAALVEPESEPVRRTQELKPVAIIKSPSGQTIFDLGQNMVGWVRLRVRGVAGTTVTLRHAEVLDKAGNLYTDEPARGGPDRPVHAQGKRRRGVRAALHLSRLPVRGHRGARGSPDAGDDHRHRRAHRSRPDRHVRHVRLADQPAAAEHRVGTARQLPRRAHRLPAARRAARLDR